MRGTIRDLLIGLGWAQLTQMLPAAPHLLARRTVRGLRLALRGVARRTVARVGARPLFRVAAGRWPAADEAQQFAAGLACHGPLPPVLRGLAQVPAARPHLTRAMLHTWMCSDEATRGRLRQAVGGPDDGSPGDPLQVWSGPRIAFLHIQKTGGSSVARLLESRCHPLQLDTERGTRDALGAAVLRHPEVMRRIRRCAVLSGHHDLPTLHRLDPGRAVFTVLRDPARRIVSLYAFWRSHDIARLAPEQQAAPDLAAAATLDFAAFLRCRHPAVRDAIDSHYVRMLTGTWRAGEEPDLADAPGDSLRRARAALAGLAFVGVTERLDASIGALGNRLDVELPAGGPRLNVTAENQLAGLPGFRPIGPVTVDAAAAAELARLTRLDRVLYQDAEALLDAAVLRAADAKR